MTGTHILYSISEAQVSKHCAFKTNSVLPIAFIYIAESHVELASAQ